MMRDLKRLAIYLDEKDLNKEAEDLSEIMRVAQLFERAPFDDNVKVAASYPGNMGAIEMFSFYQKDATPSERDEMDNLLDKGETDKAWNLLKRVTGVDLVDPPEHGQEESPSSEIIAYHGTSDMFEEFDLSESMGEYGHEAIFFTDSPSVAEGYIGRSDQASRAMQKRISRATDEFLTAWDALDIGSPPGHEGPNEPYFLQGVDRKLEWMKEDGEITEAQEAATYAAASELDSALYAEKESGWRELEDESEPEGRVIKAKLSINNPHVMNAEALPDWSIVMGFAIEKAIANGRDGVIVKNVRDNATDSMEKSTIYVVFSPEQIQMIPEEKSD